MVGGGDRRTGIGIISAGGADAGRGGREGKGEEGEGEEFSWAAASSLFPAVAAFSSSAATGESAEGAAAAAAAAASSGSWAGIGMQRGTRREASLDGHSAGKLIRQLLQN